MNSIPLNKAYLCIECEQVGDNGAACCTCGSRALLSIAKVLNRERQVASKVILLRTKVKVR